MAEKKIKENLDHHFYANNHNFSTVINNIPNDMTDTIICGDSEEILKKLPSNCVDLILTSPPYNFAIDYDEHSDDNHWKNYFDRLFSTIDQCVRVLKFGGRLVINIQPSFLDYVPTHHIISSYLMSKKLIWRNEIIWEKNNYNCKPTAWGSWKSCSCPYLKYTWEFLEVFSKGSIKKEGDSNNTDISGQDFVDWTLARWSIAPEHRMKHKKFNHPAMFPEELVRRVLQLFSYKDDIVVDPFNGVGTTTYMAMVLNRRYIGIDISEDYCKRAMNRVGYYLFN